MAESEPIRIPLPPRDSRIQDLPPVIEPPISDIPGYDGPLADVRTQNVRSEAVVDRSELEARMGRAQETALQDEQVRRHLGERYEVIGVSLVEDKDAGTDLPVLVAYSYDEGTTVEAFVSEGTQPVVTDIVRTDGQPAPTAGEIERAVRLARGDDRVARSLGEGFDAVAILASDVDPGDRFHGRRCLAVGFGPADERLPRVRVVVDLGAERVLAVSTDGVAS